MKKDKRCPHCNQVTERVRGITKQNLKNLFIPKWDMTEITITLLLIALITLSFVYKIETQQCRDFLKPLYVNDGNNCLNVCDYKCELIRNNVKQEDIKINLINVTNLSSG